MSIYIQLQYKCIDGIHQPSKHLIWIQQHVKCYDISFEYKSMYKVTNTAQYEGNKYQTYTTDLQHKTFTMCFPNQL